MIILHLITSQCHKISFRKSKVNNLTKIYQLAFLLMTQINFSLELTYRIFNNKEVEKYSFTQRLNIQAANTEKIVQQNTSLHDSFLKHPTNNVRQLIFAIRTVTLSCQHTLFIQALTVLIHQFFCLLITLRFRIHLVPGLPLLQLLKLKPPAQSEILTYTSAAQCRSPMRFHDLFANLSRMSQI